MSTIPHPDKLVLSMLLEARKLSETISICLPTDRIDERELSRCRGLATVVAENLAAIENFFPIHCMSCATSFDQCTEASVELIKTVDSATDFSLSFGLAYGQRYPFASRDLRNHPYSLVKTTRQFRSARSRLRGRLLQTVGSADRTIRAIDAFLAHFNELEARILSPECTKSRRAQRAERTVKLGLRATRDPDISEVCVEVFLASNSKSLFGVFDLVGRTLASSAWKGVRRCANLAISTAPRLLRCLFKALPAAISITLPSLVSDFMTTTFPESVVGVGGISFVVVASFIGIRNAYREWHKPKERHKATTKGNKSDDDAL